MATLGIGFTLSASAAQLAGGVNEAVKHFGRLSDAAQETQGYFEALQQVDFASIVTGVATGNWSAVASEALQYVDAIGGVERIMQDVQAATYETAEAMATLTQRAQEAGVSFQNLQIQDLLDFGVAREDILRLNASISSVNADRFLELADASNKVEQSQSRMAIAGESLLRAVLTPITGIFESIDEGAASLQNGLADILGGLSALADPIGSVLAPLLDIIGLVGEAFLKTVGFAMELVGVVLRIAGALIKVPLELFAESWSRIANVLQTGVRAAFEWLSGYIDYLHKKVDDFYNFMSQVPVIGSRFASNEGGVQSAAPQEVVEPSSEASGMSEAAAAAAKEEEKAQQDLERAIARQEASLSKAIEQAQQFGDEGFNAAVKYQEGLRALNDQLEAGILNETSYAQAAQKLNDEYRDQVKEIENRNKAEQKAADQRKRDEDRAKQQSQRDKEKKDAQAAALKEKIADKQADIDKIMADRAAALGSKSNEALKANDVRSGEGMAQYLALATGREDPAIAEYRKQTEKLNEIKTELRALQQQKVEILK